MSLCTHKWCVPQDNQDTMFNVPFECSTRLDSVSSRIARHPNTTSNICWLVGPRAHQSQRQQATIGPFRAHSCALSRKPICLHPFGGTQCCFVVVCSLWCNQLTASIVCWPIKRLLVGTGRGRQQLMRQCVMSNCRPLALRDCGWKNKHSQDVYY